MATLSCHARSGDGGFQNTVCESIRAHGTSNHSGSSAPRAGIEAPKCNVPDQINQLAKLRHSAATHPS